MAWNSIKRRLTDSAAKALASEQVQRVLNDDRFRQAVDSTLDASRAAREEFANVRTQVEDTLDAMNAGPAVDDTTALKAELDVLRNESK
ncbi:MAG: putative aminopeptidase [Bradymonadia bacterium]|jgi:predicted aminopeptidase